MSWGDQASGQGGVITRRQLRDHGLTDTMIDTLIETEAARPLARGVLIARGAPITYLASLWCAVLTTDGTLGFGTAAHLWGMAEQPPTIQVVVPHRRRVKIIAGVRLHRTFVPKTACAIRDGLPTTSRTWTILDHIGRLPGRHAQSVTDRALQRSWLTRQDIEGRLRDYPGRQGNTMLRRVLIASGDRAAAESERILHRLLRAAGIGGWSANYALWCGGILIGVIDVAFVAARLGVEVDGWAYHSDVERFQGDRTRQNTLAGAGWTVLRFTWADLNHRPAYVLAAIGQQLARAA